MAKFNKIIGYDKSKHLLRVKLANAQEFGISAQKTCYTKSTPPSEDDGEGSIVFKEDDAGSWRVIPVFGKEEYNLVREYFKVKGMWDVARPVPEPVPEAETLQYYKLPGHSMVESVLTARLTRLEEKFSKLELLTQPIDPTKPVNLFSRLNNQGTRMEKLETEGKEHLKGILYRLGQLEKEQKHEHDTRRDGQCILGQRIEDNYKRLGELEKSVNNPNSALNTWVDAIRKRLERLESVIAVPKAEPPKPKLTKWYAFCTEKQKFEYIGEYEKLYQASDVAAAKYPDALVTVSHDEQLSYGKSINELLSPTEESKPLTLNTVESGKTFKFKETFLFGSNIYTIRTGELFYWDESWKAWKFSTLSRPPNGSAPVILYPDPSKK